MNETVEMVRVYNNGNRDGSDDEGSLCLPIPPMKPFSYVRLVRGWLNMDVAEANEPRTIAIGCDPAVWSGRSYPNNAVNNRRYSLLSFLPLALFYHFRSVFNVFYLLLSLSQLIPALKVGFIVTYFSPLVFVLLLSLIKDAVDDIQRYRRDQIANKEKVEKLFPDGSTGVVLASSIHVGDLLVLRSGQRIPADCVLLRTSEKSGTCFVRTDQLDGETDWKLRYALKLTQTLNNETLCRFRANIRCEPLHKDIYKFVGMLDVAGMDAEAICLENTLWKSCVVASGTLIAAVLYTGVDTRSAMNSSKPSTKTGLIESELNFIGALCFLFLVVVSLFLVFLQQFEGDWIVMFLRFLILLSAIIPISMRVNVDVGRMWYSYEMFRDSKIDGTVVRNTNIPEELGRLQYLFTDKTGTLTKNKMEFRVIQVGVDTILNYNEVDRFRRIMEAFFVERHETGGLNAIDVGKGGGLLSQRTFPRDVTSVGEALLALILCHNVSPVMEDGRLEYQAASPDEVAFVKFCSSIGMTLTHRDVNCVRFTTPGGRTVHYDIIKAFPFTSERKCMGIIVRERRGVGEGGYKYLMKGADTKMASVLRLTDWLYESCQELSQVGLRTLVFAQRTLTEELFETFLAKYNEANADLGDTRNSSLDAAMRIIERDMKLVCVTGVEDELQDDVTTSLETLGMGGIKVWILTGDKVETATTIGHSTRLIPRNGVVEVMASSTEEDAVRFLEKLAARYALLSRGACISRPWTLILDGTSLSFCLSESVSRIFVEVSQTAYSVIVARCSPTQKAAVIHTMRKYCDKRVRMAAIGDGGNDVSMILAADVGIGVEGLEGKQASMAADFSITKFAHCVRLIMWHGRRSYCRTCRMSQFIMHRGMVYSVVQAFFSLLFAGTTMSIFNGYLLMGYTTIFTMAPVFALVLDEEIREKDVSEFPQHYKELLKARSMNTRSFLQWVWISIFQGGTMMFLSLELFSEELFQLVAVAYTSLLLTELIIVASTAHLRILWKQRRRHLYLFIAAECFSIASYFVAVVVLPETIDRNFFFSSGCWWRVTVITLAIIVPIYTIWLVSKYLLFNQKLAYSLL
ncbi:phospholipid-translocating ATPase, putative [Trypanosoma cruzi]|uniref:Phospholipid-transporting ATPase n=2 Tax=Trypanosoma cruzi TaxID=5693 RepID=V5BV40_TRYCR|nr:phospholipid-translocating ATPase, putative [Trypanosoma cruzi]ESS68423.1 phospholipid-translocating ATPase [Trypanosoma cruzi Dm28c]PBJ78990.1 phospholipid-translocating ATPase [Trypanosoma cruzi cruzi]PBJ78991.1 phospholipid-translocating ATPase [Trypanosoma cruzi cruzi]PWV00173.1 putative phospholipid-translocating ATPase [Trypanosoma cruzi]